MKTCADRALSVAVLAGLMLGVPSVLAGGGVPGLLVAPDADGLAEVRVTRGNPGSPGAPGASGMFFAPYGQAFEGGVRVASGDVTGDGVEDIITGTGAGAAGGHVKVFDGRTGAEIRSFFAYAAAFSGGVTVAAGDVNGDGFDDIITGAGPGSTGGHVKVFDGATGQELQSFFAFGGFSGGVNVASGDIDGDGRDDVIVGSGPGGGPHVKVFDSGGGAELASFFAYPAAFSGGVFVASGDVDGDGRDDIITGAGPGAAGGHVKVFSGASGAEIRSFLAVDDPSFAGGVRVAVGDVTGDGADDIITGVGPGPIASGQSHVKVFDGRRGAELASFFAYGAASNPGVFVAGHMIAAPATCPGDANGDGVVNFSDVTSVLGNFGNACP